MTVEEFIAREIQKAFAWSSSDCVSTVDAWTQHAAGISFIEAFGAVWTCKAEAEAILVETPLHIAFNRAMRQAGFVRTKEPQAGDVGLVFTERGKLCAAVFSGKMWFSRDEDGLIGVPPRGLWKAWRVA